VGIQILQPTSWRRVTPGPWALYTVSRSLFPRSTQGPHTDNEGNHGCAISTGGFKTLDQLLDLPDLNVLLGVVGLLVLGRHGRGVVVVCGCVKGEMAGSASLLRDFLDQRGASDEGSRLAAGEAVRTCYAALCSARVSHVCR
jgi:hypothetical protein